MKHIRSINPTIIGIIVLILFILGPLLLMGRCEPKSMEIRDELSSLSDVYGRAWNGTQLVTVKYELETQGDHFAVKYEEPVASAFILLPSSILDEKPEYFLMRSMLKGEEDFIYEVTVMKVLEVGSSPLSESTRPILFFHREKDRPDFLRVDTYSLKEAQRDYHISEQVSDLIQFFTSNKTLDSANANLIEEVCIFEFRVVYASEGLVAQGTIDQIQLLTVILYFGLMILFPITFLCLSKLKYRRLLDIKWIVLAGVTLRVILSLFTSHAYDMEIWKFAARTFYEHGEIALFSNWTSPPVFYFALIFSYFPYALLHYYIGFGDWRVFHHPVRAVESLSIKMPMIIADVLIFILLIKIIRHIRPSLSKKQTVFLSSLYFLNPYVIMVSSVWGMFDALAMVFIVAGIYMWVKKRYLLAGTLFAISACTKWIGVAPLLVGTILLLRQRRFETTIKMAITSAIIILAVFALPFIATNQTSYFLEVLAFRLGKGSDITIWHGITYLEYFRLQDVFSMLPDWLVSNYFFIFFGVFSVFLCFIIARSNPQDHRAEAFTLIKGTLLAFLAFYLTYLRVNQQFLLWSIALVPLLLASSKNEAIKYMALGWVIAGIVPGIGSYMLFGLVGPEYLLRLLRAHEAGFSVVFSLLCIVSIWLLLGVGKRLDNFLSHKKAEAITVRRTTRVLVYIILLMFICMLSLGVSQTGLDRIAPSWALALITVLFFVVAPFVAAVIEHVEHNSAEILEARACG
jgi:Gpi18-like mannosyltransferase